MTSPRARAEPPPPPPPPVLDELERLVATLEAEVLTLRARGGGGGGGGGGAQRVGLLESENQLLRQRIAAVREQVERLRTRLRFIEDRAE